MKRTFLAFVSLLSVENMNASGVLASASKGSLSQALVNKIQYAQNEEEALVEAQTFLFDEGETARKKAIISRLQDGQALLAAMRLEPRYTRLVRFLIENGPVIDNSTPQKLADKVFAYDVNLMRTPKSFRLTEYAEDACRSIYCGSKVGPVAELLKKRMKLYNSGNQELITMDDKEMVDELEALLVKVKEQERAIVELKKAFLAKEEKIGAQPEVIEEATPNSNDPATQNEVVSKKPLLSSISSVALGIAIGGTAAVLVSKALAAQIN